MGLFYKLGCLKDSLMEVIGILTPRKKRALMIGGALLGLGFIAGPVVQLAAVGGLIVNGLLWMLIKEQKPLMGFMNHFGGMLDIIITFGGIFSSGVSSVTGWLIGIMFGGFFTVFRQLFTIDEPEGKPWFFWKEVPA